MFVYAAIIVSLIGLLIATYTDLKSRIAPNKLNFGLAAAGLIIFGAQSIYEMSPYPVVLSFIGLCYGFLFGWVLWKIGVFAGGDVKLFMGLGALNPFTPALIKIGILSTASIPMFPLTLFMYSLLSFLPYGLGFALYRLYGNKEFQKKVAKDMKKKTLQALHASVFIAAAYVVLSAAGANMLLEIPLVLLWGLAGKRKKFITLAAEIAAAALNWQLLGQAFIGVAIVAVVLYGSAKLMFSLRPLLSKEVDAKKLEEGMIPAKTLVWKGKKVAEADAPSIGNMIKYAKMQRIGELFAPKRVIVSATKARGLTEEEAQELKRLSKRGLIGKRIAVKESMPFVPTMLLGYGFCLALGDAFWIIMLAGMI